MKVDQEHIVVILVAFLATLGCFTALAVMGSDGQSVLHDVVIGLAGALAGVAVAKKVDGK